MHPHSIHFPNGYKIRNVSVIYRTVQTICVFKWSVLAGLYEPTDSDIVSSVSSYIDCENHEDAPNFSMLTYPVELRSIAKFEKANNISVNVYAVMEEEVKTSGKRKSNPTPTPAKGCVGNADPIPKRRRCDFIDDEVEYSDSEGIDSNGEDLDGFLDDDSDNGDEGMSFYHAIDEQQREEGEEPEEEELEEVKPKRGLVYPHVM